MFPGRIPGEDIIFSWYTIVAALSCGVVFGFRNYMRGPQCMSRERLEKKTAIVTGGNTGIGIEVAKDLASRGARVIIGCRDEEKGKAAVKEIREHAGTKQAIFIKLDLASFASIREFVSEFKDKNTRLNFLINNAGVMCHPEEKSADGHEIHLATNYLGHYLLTHLLLDVMKTSGPGQIINLTCPAYQLGEIHFDDLNLEQGEYDKSAAFSQSKLAVMLFTKELEKHLEGTEIRTNAVHPGICNTDVYRHMPFMKSTFIRWSCAPLIYFLMKGSKDGAQTIIQVAVGKEEEGVSGKYYKDCRITAVTEEKATNADDAKNLWELTAKLTGVTLEASS